MYINIDIYEAEGLVLKYMEKISGGDVHYSIIKELREELVCMSARRKLEQLANILGIHLESYE